MNAMTMINFLFFFFQAIIGHDLVACALLQRGADVTLYDDSGLTPVDVAKTKKVKATLKHAWAEATQSREPRNLAPVREGSARSLNSCARRKGEVVFDVSGIYLFLIGGQIVFFSPTSRLKIHQDLEFCVL